MEGKMFSMRLKVKYFQKENKEKDLQVYKVSDRKQLKIITPKQTLQRLPTALAQLKAGHTSEIY